MVNKRLNFVIKILFTKQYICRFHENRKQLQLKRGEIFFKGICLLDKVYLVLYIIPMVRKMVNTGKRDAIRFNVYSISLSDWKLICAKFTKKEHCSSVCAKCTERNKVGVTGESGSHYRSTEVPKCMYKCRYRTKSGCPYRTRSGEIGYIMFRVVSSC